MTDARLPDRWLNDRRLQRLSPEHFRTYVNALMWSVGNRTDGHIERADAGMVPHWSAGAAKAFVDAGLFTPQSDGWLITDYVATQTSREQLAAAEAARVREREKKARQRAAKAAEKAAGESAVPGDIPGEVPRDVPGESTGQDRLGQDRPGQGDQQDRSRRNNGAEPYAPSAEQLHRIEQNVRRGYES
jgi:hypothetical protein